ncbi:hypothetical protein ACFWH1_33090 [Streptomyces sp. NPDC127037]|uniref:hypothetical protein n=1 Tax=Streptomyces sp. NPDC127037 TaxID=3347113 RepID=UPI00366567E1
MFRKLITLGVSTDSIFTVDIADGRVERVYADTGSHPDGVQIADGVAYWTTMGTPSVRPGLTGEAALDYSARNGGVHSIRVDGTDRRDLTAPGEVTTGKQLTMADAWLYWGDREGHRVTRARPDGSDREDLVVNPPGIDNQCVGVAVDTARGYLYWTQKGPAKGGTGRILRAPLERTVGRSPENRTDIEVLWEKLPEPIDLEIVDGLLYWTDRGAPPNGNTLNRAPLPAPGEGGSGPEILADGFDEAIGLAVDPEAGTAYVSDLAGHIYTVPLPQHPSGIGHMPPKRLLADLGMYITGLAAVAD